MRKHLLLPALLALFVLGVSGVFAQTTEYSFTSTMGTYTPITGGLALGTETTDDQRFLDPAVPAGGTVLTGPGLDIGFSFTFNNVVFDRLGINANGWISFGQSALGATAVNMGTTSAYTPLSSTTVITPDILTNRVSIMGRDLSSQVGGSIRLETIGTAPNRVCVVQWTNYKKYSTGGTGDSYNFQIRLYETTNNVQLVYGPFITNATANNFQVGLRGPQVTDFNARATATDWTATTAAIANTEFCVINQTVFPPNGLTFSFNYPVANQPPNPANLVFPANNALQISPFMVARWSSGGGLPTGYKIFFGTNNPPTNIANNVDLGNVQQYDPPGELGYNTVYYWKVVPYNTFGDATNCPVWQFTTHGDGSITTLPYVQAFDAVTAPDLPFDWTALVQSSTTAAYVRTVATSPHTAPNTAVLFNSTDLAGELLLIGPALAPAIPTNTVRVKFWAKPGGSNYNLSVGVISNPTNPSTYQEVQSVTLPTTVWTEYVVTLAGYTGAGQMIAFRHPHGGTGRTIYVDSVTFELIAQNDLACLGLSGNTSPTVNNPVTHNAAIFNWGSVTQTNYTVKLFNAANNQELAQAAGISSAPGATVQVPLTWTPTAVGPITVYGKVFLTGDQNPTNDQSPNLTISVMNTGQTVITIGQGTEVNTTSGTPTPYGTFYKAFRQQYLYTAAEIFANGGAPGNITAIGFDVQALNTCLPMPNYTVRLKHTTQSVLTTTFELGDYTTVWNHPEFLPSVGWNTHAFTTPFVWDGVSNLIIDLSSDMIPVAYTQNASVYYTPTTGVNTCLRFQSDSANGSTGTTGTVSVNRANTRLFMQIGGMGTLSGTISSGGNPLSGALVVVNNTTFSQTTGASGTYSFPFLQPGNFTVTASKLGYETQTLPVVIVADQTTTQNFNLVASSTVNVTGTIVGSDNPTVGLAGATVNLTGVMNYSGTTNAMGQFTITGVLSGNTYNYVVAYQGYQNATGSITVGAGNYSMGTVIVNELTLPPVQVQAELNAPQTAVTVTWRPPGATGGFYFNDFEADNGGWVPTSNWADPLGDWEWSNEYDIADWVTAPGGSTGTSVIPPPAAHSGTGLWATKVFTNHTNSGGFSYLTQTFDFTGLDNPVLRFYNWNNSFGNFDFGQITVNGTLVWGPQWHTTANINWEETIINLAAYGGMANVVIQFQHFATTVVNYAGWYIDDVYIGPPETLRELQARSPRPKYNPINRFADPAIQVAHAEMERQAVSSNRQVPVYNRVVNTPVNHINERIPVGYKVWRLLQGNEQNEATWTLLTAATIADTFYVNTGWQSLPDGHYKWAVKTVYTNNVLSNPAFSNMLRKRPNDLSALQLTGTTTPSVGIQTTYTVRIKNTGTSAQNAGAYTVKLMSGTTQLASVNGPAIAVNEELNVSLNWTPTTAGPMALFGKTVHTGDTMPDNDNTPVLNVSVMPAGVVAVTIGEGNQLDGRPFEFLNNNSLYQTLYYPSEIGLYGNITAVSFYNSFTTNFVNKPIKLWLGMTQMNDLSGGWILPSQNLTLVYDGTANFPSGQNTITVPLQTPFQYTGGNLVLYANRPMDTVIGVAADDFQVQTIGTNRARKLSSNTVTYDPAAPSAVGTLSGQFPKTTFHMTAIGTAPIYVVNPSQRDFGTVLINSTNNQTFTITNAGGGMLTINSIAIAGSPHYSLQNMPTLPANLNFGETITFVGRYLPTAEGTHTATITVMDNMTRLPQTIALTGNCIDTQINALPYAQNFDAVTVPNLPPDWNRIVQATVTTAYAQTYTTTPFSAPNCAGMTNSTDANATVLLIAPPYATTIPANTTRVKFMARSSAANYLLSVGIITDYQNAATYTETQVITLTTTWTEYVVTFAGYTGTGRTVAFKHGLGGTSRLIYIDNVMLEVIPQNDLAALSIQGNATPTVGQPSQYTVSIFNWGTNAQSTYQVKLFSQGNIEVGSVNGPNINPGQTQAVAVPWTPTTEGPTFLYGKVVLTGDQNNLNDQTANLNVNVQPQGVLAFTVGAGDQTARIPIDMFYKNSMHQYIIYPAEIGNTIGQIYGLGLYNQFTQDLLNMPTKVWIGTTTQTDLAAGWIPTTGHTLVFDGPLNYPTGTNTINVPFSAPYLYLTGENIVLTFKRPMDTQYYQSTNLFQAQTQTQLRARNIFSDTVDYDPAVPPTTGGTNTGQFAKTTLFMIPGGVGHFTGTVLGENSVPLGNVVVATTGYGTVTNAQGQFTINNMLPNNYTVSFSVYGYINQTQNIVIIEDETTTLNVNMAPMPRVTVSGTVLASDTGAGLSGAEVHLVGYANYNANTTATGSFTIPLVYANNPYQYVIMSAGYTSATGTIVVGATNHNMGNMTLNEIAYAPHSVVGTQNPNGQEVSIAWQAPDANAVEVTESFEDPGFPPQNWTQTITNTGAANTSGVYPTWCRFGAITVSGTPADPTDGSYQAGLWWNYEHQDEWLITPAFNCPPSAYVRFDSYVFLGSTNGDHYYVKVSVDNGNTWTMLWDASAQTGGWNYYASPIQVDLSAYGGQQIKIAFHAVDGPGNDGLWYVWFMDNLYIGNSVNPLDVVRFPAAEMITRSASNAGFQINPVVTTNPSRRMEEGGIRTEPRLPMPHEVRYTPSTPRVLTGYKVWRLSPGNEGNEASWALLTPDAITVTNLIDTGWAQLPNGNYRWAVKATYTAGVTSVPSFSNVINKFQETGMIAGVVRRQNTTPIVGATVTAGGYSATTNNAGAYTIVAAVGTYSVTASATGFISQTVENVVVSANQTSTVNFTMIPGSSNEDDVIPVNATALNGNYPNPFNPETTISYAIKEAGAVCIEIYNVKGQLIRTLVNEHQNTGHYKVVFDGKDARGKAISSGIYFYRMKTDNFIDTKKMILMQ
ncbi:MAG: carboxypeptidase regulatory-like domain-containing protein [Candidatus Cloacimonadaceae bacterium]|nr:carboxypeptidase regulatory-like domain-containing protein [Candidatus Cloacimonadaceae bacterium]